MKVKVFAVLAAMLVLGWCTWRLVAFPFVTDWTDPITLTQQPDIQSSATVGYKFDIQGLPALTPKAGHTAWYQVLVNTGDGHFLNMPLSQLQGTSYKYQTGGTYTAWAEVTAVYDDLSKKRKRPQSLTATITGTNGYAPDPVSLAGNFVKIERASNTVPGDVATYMVVVNFPCGTGNASPTGSLELEYNTDILEPDLENAALMTNQYDQFAAPSDDFSTANLRKIKWAYNSPITAGRQHTVFARFKVKSTASLGLNNVLTARLINSGCSALSEDANNDRTPDGEAVLAEPVADSHDPNQKWLSVDKTVCQTGEKLNYTISFKNDGPAPPTEVLVEDVLDEYLENSVYNFQETLGRNWVMNSSTANQTVGTDRKATWKFNGVGLGTGMTHSFSFSVDVQKTAPCNAICNRAKIRFDCQPPQNTNLTITPIACTTNCDTCIQLPAIYMPPNNEPQNPGNSAVWNNAPPPFLTASGTSFTAFKWYPPIGISPVEPSNAAEAASMIITNVQKEDYVLVASKGCERQIIYQSVDPCAGLKLTIDASQSVLKCCPPGSKGKIVAHANFTTGHQIEWSDCSQNTPSMTMTNLEPGKYWVGVYDKTTGCTAEQAVIVELDCSTPIPWCLIGGLLPLLAIAVFFLRKSRTRAT